MTPSREWTLRGKRLVRGKESWTTPDWTLIQQPDDHLSGMSSDEVKHWLKPVLDVIWGLLSIPKSLNGQREIFPPLPNLYSSCFIQFNDGRGEWPFTNITHSLELDPQTVESQVLLDPGRRHARGDCRPEPLWGEEQLHRFSLLLLWQPWDFCCSKRLNATKRSLGWSTNESDQTLICV